MFINCEQCVRDPHSKEVIRIATYEKKMRIRILGIRIYDIYNFFNRLFIIFFFFELSCTTLEKEHTNFVFIWFRILILSLKFADH